MNKYIYNTGSDFVIKELDRRQEINFHRKMVRSMSTEFSRMGGGAYIPKLIKYWNDLYQSVDFDEKRITDFRSSIPKEQKMGIFIEKNNLFVILMFMHFFVKEDYKISNDIIKFLGLKSYYHLINIHFPRGVYREDLWKKALDKLSERHLFKVKNGIPNAVIYIAEEAYKKWHNILKKAVKTYKYDDLVKLIGRIFYDIRSRIWQSVRSFAESYHKLFDNKEIGTSTGNLDDIDKVPDTNAIQIISNKISEIICVNSQIDNDALIAAIKFSGLRKDLASNIVNSISDIAYKDDLKFIIVLLYKIRNDIKLICKEKNRNSLIRKIISEVKIGKYNISEEILKILYTLDNKSQLKTINKSKLLIFFLHYLTLFMKRRICY